MRAGSLGRRRDSKGDDDDATGVQEGGCKGSRRTDRAEQVHEKGGQSCRERPGTVRPHTRSAAAQVPLQDAKLLWERDRDISVLTKYVFSSPLPFTLMTPRHVHV